MEWWKSWRISEFLYLKGSSGVYIFTGVLHTSHTYLLFISCLKTATVGPIIEFPGRPSSPGGPSYPGSPYAKRNIFRIISTIFSFNFKSFTEKNNYSVVSYETIFELGNMKPVFLEEGFTTLILTSFIFLLLPSCVKVFVLPWQITWWL